MYISQLIDGFDQEKKGKVSLKKLDYILRLLRIPENNNIKKYIETQIDPERTGSFTK